MILFFSSQGSPLGIVPERVYQGSNKANTIYFVCPTASSNAVTVAFSLPSGSQTVRHLMTASTNPVTGVFDGSGNVFNTWSYEIPSAITQKAGNVTMQFYITASNNVVITTSSTVLCVEKGVEPQTPQQSDAYQDVLDDLVLVQEQTEENEDDITLLQTKTNTLETLVASHTTSLSTVSTKAETNRTNIASLQSRTTTLETKMNGAQSAISFASYSEMVNGVYDLGQSDMHVGQSIYIETIDVPDLWVSYIGNSKNQYTFTSDASFISTLRTNGYVDIGYYRICMLETQKVDLSNYLSNTDITLTNNADGTANLVINVD